MGWPGSLEFGFIKMHKPCGSSLPSVPWRNVSTIKTQTFCTLTHLSALFFFLHQKGGLFFFFKWSNSGLLLKCPFSFLLEPHQPWMGSREGRKLRLHLFLSLIPLFPGCCATGGTDSWEESHGSVVKLTGNSDPLCFSFTVSLCSLILSIQLSFLSKPCVWVSVHSLVLEGHKGGLERRSMRTSDAKRSLWKQLEESTGS